MKILIADDDLTSRSILQAVLVRSGFTVIESVNGQQAWEEIQKPDAPNLIILDWIMPEMNGLDVVEKTRGLNKEPEPYIIMLTSKSDKSDIIKGLNTGADDYLSKPFDLGELRARINAGKRIVELNEKIMNQIQELRKANDHIKTLQGIIPICSYCHKIRTDEGSWDQMELYISRHSEAQFSHGICPECMKEHYPGVSEKHKNESH
ncbi:MAG: response regulator transcription factor [Spirochaetales bacterium]|nr:response regulator transcription factor [Spirochaetales bacterium]